MCSLDFRRRCAQWTRGPPPLREGRQAGVTLEPASTIVYGGAPVATCGTWWQFAPPSAPQLGPITEGSAGLGVPADLTVSGEEMGSELRSNSSGARIA